MLVFIISLAIIADKHTIKEVNQNKAVKKNS
jgi:hypothetical protein